MISRRDFLTVLAASGLPVGAFASREGGEVTEPSLFRSREFLVSAQGRSQAQFSLGMVNQKSQQFSQALSGFRGHGAAQHPLFASHVVMYGRRPGRYGIVVDVLQQKVVSQFQVASNRFFYGHGCFSQDGKTLFTTEGDVKTGAGKIGVRDALTYQQLGEFDTHGIGPHDIQLMPNGKTLVIANGGILTRPETGRKKLNLPDMTSTLTYLNIETGLVEDEFTVPEPKASIRHLDIAEDGTVAIAMQVQRPATGHNNVVPLGALHKPGQAIQLLQHPEKLVRAMNDYMGSVAVNNQTETVGFTSPRGNVVGFWGLKDGAFKGYHQLQDVCGIAVSQDQSHFVISNSFGEVRELNATSLQENTQRRWQNKQLAWDNHLLSIKV